MIGILLPVFSMISIFYRHQDSPTPEQRKDASNVGLRSPVDPGLNHGGWTSRGSEVKDPHVVAEKVPSSMLSNQVPEAVEHGAPPITTPQQSPVFARKLLDSFRHGNFLISLFYEKKNLCLALYDIATDRELAKWTFGHQRRHQRTFKDESLSVKVHYRPAVIEVNFAELGQKGFMKRIFGNSLESQDSWSHYELGCDGAVRISRPGRVLMVS
jgi:hypothetical protein